MTTPTSPCQSPVIDSFQKLTNFLFFSDTFRAAKTNCDFIETSSEEVKHIRKDINSLNEKIGKIDDQISTILRYVFCWSRVTVDKYYVGLSVGL